jgi:hypothetical protein
MGAQGDLAGGEGYLAKQRPWPRQRMSVGRPPLKNARRPDTMRIQTDATFFITAIVQFVQHGR